jgi:hypothetical protein
MPIGAAAGAPILNKEFNGTDYANLTSYWIGFRSSGVELTSGDSPGYARIEVEVNTTNYPLTSTTLISNAVAFSTPQATGPWLEADEIVLYDASTAGNIRYSGLLDQPFAMVTGKTRSFGVGALRVRFI